jgi:nucleotide-binding universal stress UspA family protein
MFKEIIVGVGPAEGSFDAIALAKDLAAPRASFTLAEVIGGAAPGANGALSGGGRAAEAHARLATYRSRAQLSKARLRVCSAAPVGAGLHALAAAFRADLIVVGACERSELTRLVFGSDALGTLHRAPCAVAIAARGYGLGGGLKRIGVALGAPAVIAPAIGAARAIATHHGAAVEAMAVVSGEDLRALRPVPRDWPYATERLLDGWSERLRRWELDGTAVLGRPRDELLELADRVDLLLVGAPRAGQTGHAVRAVHGSLIDHLARQASCSLLMLSPRPVDESPLSGLPHDTYANTG